MGHRTNQSRMCAKVSNKQKQWYFAFFCFAKSYMNWADRVGAEGVQHAIKWMQQRRQRQPMHAHANSEKQQSKHMTVVFLATSKMFPVNKSSVTTKRISINCRLHVWWFDKRPKTTTIDNEPYANANCPNCTNNNNNNQNTQMTKQWLLRNLWWWQFVGDYFYSLFICVNCERRAALIPINIIYDIGTAKHWAKWKRRCVRACADNESDERRALH